MHRSTREVEHVAKEDEDHLAHAHPPGEDGGSEQRADGGWGARVGEELVQRPRRKGPRLRVVIDEPLREVREHPVKRRAQRATTALQQGGQHSQHVLADGDVGLRERMVQRRKQRVDVLHRVRRLKLATLEERHATCALFGDF